MSQQRKLTFALIVLALTIPLVRVLSQEAQTEHSINTKDGQRLSVSSPAPVGRQASAPPSVLEKVQRQLQARQAARRSAKQPPRAAPSAAPDAASAPLQCQVQAISLGQTINGALSTSDCRIDSGHYGDVYSFSGSAGQRIAIELGSAAFDTILGLLLNNNVIEADDDGGPGSDSRIPPESGFITLQQSGTYFIVVSSYSPGSTGSYTLRLLLDTQPPPTPTPSPSPSPTPTCHTVSSLSPTSGAPGSTVTITGINFTSLSAVRFSNNVAAQFTVVSNTQITATVPNGAVTGPITLSKPNCPDQQTQPFTVTTSCHTASGISPSSGPVGTLITVTGTNLTGVNVVRFNNNVSANFTAVSPTQLTTTVPTGATTGPIVISKPNCPDVQTASFTLAPPPPCVVAPSGLVAWWPGNGNANDLVGGNHGTLRNGALANTPGKVGQAFLLDGVDDFVEIPDAPSLKPAQVTVDAWVRIDALDTAGASAAGLQYLVFKRNTRTSNFEGYALTKERRDGRDQFCFTIASASGAQAMACSQTTVVAGRFYHLAGTYDGAAVKLYVNGTLENQAAASFALDYGTRPVFIGTSGETFYDGKLKGVLDEVEIANRALMAAEIQAVFNADLSGKCTNTPPCPAVLGSTPNSAAVGALVTITGLNLNGVTAVRFANNVAAQFTVNSNTQLTATVPMGAVNGPITISKPGCADVQTAPFIVSTSVNPPPSLASLNPGSANAGGVGFTLTVNGADFVNGAVVRWNGNNRTTTFVSSTQLTAAIPASDIATASSAMVTVFNPEPGGGTSNALTFTINPSTTARVVRVVPTSAAAGSQVSVPIELLAEGNENGLSFSLTFDPSVLSNPQAAPGSDAVSATVLTNPGQVAQGRLGVSVTRPPGQAFAAGTRQALLITFTSASGAMAGSTPIGFGDQPVAREVVDTAANRLPATFTGGQVTILPGGYEADVAPRPNGDNNGTVTLSDYVQVGRFAVGLDTAANGGEFQRADCAPRETLGNGAITLADYVQAGRYAVGLDPITPAGGPTAPLASAQPLTQLLRAPLAQPADADEPRLVRALSRSFESGQSNLFIIELTTRGDENALAFSLNFNPRHWRFMTAGAGRDAKRASLQVNASQAAAGRLGLALVLPPGETLKAGQREVVVLSFASLTGAPGNDTKLGFSDEPVAREVVDAETNSLPAVFATESATPGIGSLANVSAADFSESALVREAMAIAFGVNLAITTAAAEASPLPTSLAGTLVRIRDSAGVEHTAPLLFVSPDQVNYLIPPGTALGPATVTIISGDGAISVGEVLIVESASSRSTANAARSVKLNFR